MYTDARPGPLIAKINGSLYAAYPYLTSPDLIRFSSLIRSGISRCIFPSNLFTGGNPGLTNGPISVSPNKTWISRWDPALGREFPKTDGAFSSSSLPHRRAVNHLRISARINFNCRLILFQKLNPNFSWDWLSSHENKSSNAIFV